MASHDSHVCFKPDPTNGGSFRFYVRTLRYKKRDGCPHETKSDLHGPYPLPHTCKPPTKRDAEEACSSLATMLTMTSSRRPTLVFLVALAKSTTIGNKRGIYNLRPRRPPFLLVESEGMGVTSSIRPILIPDRARPRRADWAPGPGCLVPVPPVARSLMWRAVIPTSLHFAATSCEANMAA